MFSALLCALALSAPLQPPPAKTDDAKPAAAKDALPDEEKIIQTPHEITVNGAKISYTATVGFLPIRSQ